MADVKISELPAILTPAAEDVHEVVQGITNKRKTSFQILNSIGNLGLNADGSIDAAGGQINLNVDGSANFSSGDVNIVPTGGILTFEISAAGTGYNVDDVLTVNSGNGDGTIHVQTVGGSGEILIADVVAPGSGYLAGELAAPLVGGNDDATISILSVGPETVEITIGETKPGVIRVRNSGTDNIILRGDGDVEIIDKTKGVIVTDDDNIRWRIRVSTIGVVTATTV